MRKLWSLRRLGMLAKSAALIFAAISITVVTPNIANAGVGRGVWTTINHASLFQCPHAVIGDPAHSCNQGEVPNGVPSGHPDDVAAICEDRTSGASPWGQPWNLVLDHANLHVGYIDHQFLVSQNGATFPTDVCDDVGNGVFATINHASLFQCPRAVIGDPAHSCNQGEIVNGLPSGHPDEATAICQLNINSPWGHHWWLVIDNANQHVGFIDSGFLTAMFDPFTPQAC